ncbi:aminopeptidase [bacterium]|nr:aminopeptidase [bacterium]
MLEKYAKLLVDYCVGVQPKQRVLIKSTYLAEPLLQKLYQLLLERGCIVEFDLSFQDQDKIMYDFSSNDQLSTLPVFYHKAVEEFDVLIRVIAPFNLKSTAEVSSDKKRVLQEAMAPLRKRYMQRSAKKELQWVLCVYPTQAAAQECGMSLADYENFVYQSCMLDTADPIASWKHLSDKQQYIVDYLNKVSHIRYVGLNTDISFSTKDRIWINSDGHYNMPSGEVFTGPVEDSVQGHVYFTYPTVYEGADVEGVFLEVDKGVVSTWKADKGQDVLDRVFSIEGARQFGEVAIGTNYSIQRATKNILFDEKIGGSIHMAIGASYPETGGNNESAVHRDMIKDMKTDGQIFADDILIYENGEFIIS